MHPTLTPVLNVDSSLIVFLPIDNPELKAQDAVFEIVEVTEFKLLGVYDNDYKQLCKAISGLPVPSDEDTKKFLVDTIHQSQDKNGRVLSLPAINYIYENYEHLGYGQPDKDGKATAPILFMYEKFATMGGRVVELVNDLLKIIPRFKEGTPNELVKLFELDVSSMDDEGRYDAVINAIESEDNTIYETSYEVDGQDIFLYSKIAA